MNANDLKSLTDALSQDISFVYNGIECTIIPINRNSISVSYGMDRTKDYASIDAMMTDLFWDGKSLNEIADKIELV